MAIIPQSVLDLILASSLIQLYTVMFFIAYLLINISEMVEAMDTKDLKFVLKLLGFTDYRAPLSKIQLNNQTKASEREKICRTLCDRGWVQCSHEVTKLKIAPPGKALLKLDPAGLPVTDQELKVLRTSEKEKITPGKTKVPAAQRRAGGKRPSYSHPDARR